MSNLLPHPFQEHPWYPDYCAYSVGDEDYCKRSANHEIHTKLEFKNTKAAMEYAQQHRIPVVVPVYDPHNLESDIYHQIRLEVWAKVFQIVSDNPQLFTREAIKQLEAARENDGCGPQT